MKTDRYYIELLYAPFIALTLGVVNLIWPNVFKYQDPIIIISRFIDISFIVFGFLLTVLALILQSTQEIRSRKLYPRLIRFNKRIVYLSLFSGVYSLLYSSMFTSISKSVFKEYCVSIFIVLFIWVILDLLHFVSIFYKLAENNQI